MYLRNQNIRDESFDEQYKNRAECGKTRGHIKGTVKFDIRRVRNISRKLYSLSSFVSYKLLMLIELQNKEALKLEFQFKNLSIFSLFVDFLFFSNCDGFKDSIELVEDTNSYGRYFLKNNCQIRSGFF